MATIEKRGKSYRITINAGFDENGKQRRFRKTWTPPEGLTKRQEKDAVSDQVVLFRQEVARQEKGEIITSFSRKITLQTVADMWLDDLEQNEKVRTRTLQRYKTFRKRVYAALGRKPIKEITSGNINTFIQNLSKAGIKEKRSPDEEPAALSPKTIRAYLSFMSGIFEYAITQDIVEINPCKSSKVKPPKLQKPEHKFYSLEEVQRFMKSLEGEPLQYRVFFTLAYTTGARRGELLGLEWRDFNFHNQTMSIERSSLYTKEKGIFTDTTKTEESQRVIKIPFDMVELLKQYKEWQDAQAEALGDQWRGFGRLFTQWDGQPMHPNTPATWLKRFCERTGQRYVNIHGFRHTNASLLLENGANIAVVSSRLGHSNITTTMNIYTHATKEADAKAADDLGNMLFKKHLEH